MLESFGRRAAVPAWWHFVNFVDTDCLGKIAVGKCAESDWLVAVVALVYLSTGAGAVELVVVAVAILALQEQPFVVVAAVPLLVAISVAQRAAQIAVVRDPVQSIGSP